MRVRLVGKVGSARAGVEAGSARGVAGLLAERSISASSKGTTSGEELLAVGVVVLLLALLGSAAADGEDPEETGTDAEGSADPDDGQEATIDVDLGAVEGLGAVNNTSNDGDGGSGERVGKDDDGGGEGRFTPRQAGNGTREV